MGKKLEASLAVLNGAIGDYLARTGNGLATEMALVAHLGDDAPLVLDQTSLARALAAPTGKVVVLVHGLMVTETVWDMPGGDYGQRLARDLGFTPIYVRYNSGLAIAANGASLARLLEALVQAFPVPVGELVPIGYSMGGLVVRSACHVARLAGLSWLPRVHRAMYLGTPHLGAPFERVGRVVSRVLRAIDDPYTRLVAEIADLRSDGVKDLGDAALRHEDRAVGARRIRLRSPEHPVPLLPEIAHYLVAGSLADPRLAMWFGDALVPLQSAMAGHLEPSPDTPADPTGDLLPRNHVRVFEGLHHLKLAHDPSVYECLRDWCAADAPNGETR